ncbi:MAG: MFS transporter [Chloroflexota bacterium]|nr:MFS transporter [Chloroflexota bacterium]
MTAMEGERRADSVWRNTDFVRLWLAGSISLFGSLVTRTALPFAAILALGAGPIEIAFLRALELLPGLMLGLFAGAWVDRLRRRPIMIVADIGRAALLGSIPIAAVLNVLGMGQLYLVAFLAASLTTFFDVADRAYLPTVIERDQIVPANSALTASASVAEFSAFGVSGFLIQLFSAPLAIAIDAVSFLVSALFLGTIRRPEPARPPVAGREPVLREIREGLRIVGGSPILRALAGAGAASHVLWGVFGASYLLFASQDLGLGPAAIGVIAGLGGVGSFIGAILTGRSERRLGVGRTIVVGMLGLTIGSALIPLAPEGALVLAATLLIVQQLVGDSSATLFEITQVSLQQSIVEDRLLGRVGGSIRFFEDVFQLAGTIAAGVIAELLGLRAAMALGILGGLVAVAFLWFSPIPGLRTMPTRPATLRADELPLTE